MSTAHNDALWLRPYEEIDATVPETRVTALPGRIAALSHPINRGTGIVLPNKELYDPDLATVVSSGVSAFQKGDVVVLAPDHGAFVPNKSPDGREMRIVGVACPWWESVLATYDAHGLHPAPGWMLVELESEEVRKSGSKIVRPAGPPNNRTPTAIVIASNGDRHSEPYKGERVVIEGLRTYTVRGGLHLSCPEPLRLRTLEPFLALVRAPIASKPWLLSLNSPLPSGAPRRRGSG